MLKQLRDKKTKKRILWILSGVIIFAFVLWGSGSMLSNQEDTTPVGRIFGRPIPPAEYRDAVIAVRNQAAMQFGDKLEEAAQYLNLESQAWDRLILLEEAKRRRIRVSDVEVVELIQKYPFFRNRNGAFDERTYEQIVRFGFHTQPRAFEEETRRNLTLAKLYEQVTASVKLTDKDITDEYRRANEQLTIAYAFSDPASFAPSVSVNEEEIKDYYAKNALSLRVPLSFNLEYIVIPAEGRSEESLQNLLRQIVGKIRKDTPLAQTAELFKLTAKETGLFAETDPLPGLGWLPQVSLLIAKTKPGELLPPFAAEKNYCLARVKERKEPFVPALDAIKDKVTEALRKQKSEALAKAKIESCLEKARAAYAASPASANLSAIAAAEGLKGGVSAPFKFHSYIEGIGASDTFWLVADQLPEHTVSDLIMTPAGLYLITRTARTPVDEKKFSEEKEAFTKTTLSQKKDLAFSQFLTDLQEKSQRF